MSATRSPAVSAVASQPVAVLPFDFDDNEIVVAVKVNDSGEPLHFAVDSGTTSNVIDKAVAERCKLRLRDYPLFGIFGVKVRARIRGRGYGEKGYGLQSAEHVRLSIRAASGDFFVPESNYIVTTLPKLRAEKSIDGLLGSDFLKKYVVAIDYAHHTVTLYDRKGYRYAGNGQSIPLQVDFWQPSVQVVIQPLKGEPFRAKLLLDTGNGNDLFLNTPFVNRRKLLVTSPSVPFSSAGPAGSVSGRNGRLESLAFGDYKIEHPPVSLLQSKGGEAGNKDRDGGIGNKILSRFDVVLDLSGRHLYLEPNTDFAKPFPPILYSGMFSKPVADGLQITGVDPDSPGALAGFVPDDTIVAVDDVPIAGMTTEIYTKRFLDNTTHRFLIRRRDKKITIEMTRITF